MNSEEIKSIIIDQKEELDDLFAKEKIIKREVPSEELLKFLKYPNILAILGIRRSGIGFISNAAQICGRSWQSDGEYSCC